jgi:tetratricopeptide (TPR) repeat protein
MSAQPLCLALLGKSHRSVAVRNFLFMFFVSVCTFCICTKAQTLQQQYVYAGVPLASATSKIAAVSKATLAPTFASRETTAAMAPFVLPPAPPGETGPVKAWTQPVVIPTYLPMPADKNPMFLEKRVYQGSSGAIYPLPFYDRIATEAVPHSWQAVHIENEFIRAMVLPEVGGRIHIGLDKTNNYDFFYRQNVMKPALVGLAGPWCSGGVEFNWPQHHRPATYMPVEVSIESHADGSRTIWCSDHDPMNRLKGLHGVCLHPGKAYIELKVRLYNRTPFVQTFLWWANLATHVHELYQSFFPPDVHYVADHAKRAISKYPLCEGQYYGVNYAARAKRGIPEEERPDAFVPPGTYPANDISWYANIPVPTSYMAMGSKEDFSGGYDHKKRAGLILLADHHIAPGKKQWTWGNHKFGYAWDRNLTDNDGPYIELMTGVFTDNQPDFSFLDPGETKSFSQYWYPIREIGPAQKANLDAAVSLTVEKGTSRIGVCVTRAFPRAQILLKSGETEIKQWQRDLLANAAFVDTIDLPAGTEKASLTLLISDADSREILLYSAVPTPVGEPPPAATEPQQPADIAGNDELYVTGLHLEQYRHATRRPEMYWREALSRDPGDARCNNAMGAWHLRRGEFVVAEMHFRAAIARLSARNANPYDEEPHYNLGLALRYLGRDDEAYDSFAKAAWSKKWRAAACHCLAQIDASRGDWRKAGEHLTTCLTLDADSLNARNLAVIMHRYNSEWERSDQLLAETLALDPLDAWARYLSVDALPADNQMALDLAFDYARAGLYFDAIAILDRADAGAKDGSVPMVLYTLGCFREMMGDDVAAKAARGQAAAAPPDYCFPNRLEELVVLQTVVESRPADARAPYYLGNLLYSRRRQREAIAYWEKSAQLDPQFSIVWRNLGIGYFNVLGDAVKARTAFDRALQANPADGRLLYERDQLWKRTGERPEARLAELEQHPELVRVRDDLCVEIATLYNQTRQYEKAMQIVRSRGFQPWEGGEGLALGQHVRTHVALGRLVLAEGDAKGAVRLFQMALDAPSNLGEAKHPLANQSDIHYWLGAALDAAGDPEGSRRSWEIAARHRGDFQQMRVTSFSELTLYSALAMMRLGRIEEAKQLLCRMLAFAEALMNEETKIDYFATSLPTMLLFDDDAKKRNAVTSHFLRAQAWFGLGDVEKSRAQLNRVLELDPNHALAADLTAQLEMQSAIARADCA